MQPRTVLRFLGERPEAGSALRLEAGEVELESGDALALETELGLVRLEAGTRVRARGGESSRVEVVAGSVVFEDEGEQRTVQAGDAIVLSVGRVVFEDEIPIAAPPAELPREGPPPDVDAEADADAEVDADAELEGEPEEEPAGQDALLIESLARAHVAIPAGESATIHDAGAPTAVRIGFGAGCPGRGVVTLRVGRRTQRVAGEGSAVVSLPPGRVRYTVDCAEGADPRGGTLMVRRDDGSGRLDPVPPRNVVDADGRTYDVLFQNALPILTVRWREASGAAAVLHVSSAGHERTLPAPAARIELGSGELAEGTHRVWFTAGGRTSPATSLRIRFDNAAPAASLREPGRDATLVPAQSVRVAGVALRGFEVRASGEPLPIDDQMRFVGEVRVPTDTDALAVRFSHPRRGVHYYLRRVSDR